jgi:hypothetical protein
MLELDSVCLKTPIQSLTGLAKPPTPRFKNIKYFYLFKNYFTHKTDVNLCFMVIISAFECGELIYIKFDRIQQDSTAIQQQLNNNSKNIK